MDPNRNDSQGRRMSGTWTATRCVNRVNTVPRLRRSVPRTRWADAPLPRGVGGLLGALLPAPRGRPPASLGAWAACWALFNTAVVLGEPDGADLLAQSRIPEPAV